MEPTAKYGILLTITKWLAAVSIPLFIFRVATKRAITRGARFKTSQALIIAGAPFLTISAACSTAAVLMFGPFGAVGWMCAAIFLAYWYVFTPGQEKEDWLRVEMRFFDSMAAGGLVVGAVGGALLFLRLYVLGQ